MVVGEWVESCSWFLGAASVSSPPPTAPEGCPGWLVGPQAVRELGSWERMQTIRKARKIILTVRLYYAWRIQLLLSPFYR